jgi:Ran GTPase-activating protein (RanGAP) involved in mRNA processing and transport
MSQITPRFGELRSACHDGRVDASRGRYLWLLVEAAERVDSSTYFAQWVPYLRDVMRRVRIEWPAATSPSMFHEMCRVLPFFRHRCALADGQHATLDELLDSSQLDRLCSLSIHHIEWARDGMRHLAAALSGCRGLIHLDLSQCVMQREAFAQFCERSWPDSLRALTLRHSLLRPRHAVQLQSASLLHGLSGIDLSHNKLGDEGVEMLCEVASSWQSLKLSHNEVSARGVARLSAAPQCHTLLRLDVESNDLGPEGARHLGSAHSGLARLESLNVRFNELGDAGAVELAKSAIWTRLRKLDVSSNYMSMEGVKALCEAEHMSLFEVLNLSNNPLSHEEVARLITSSVVMRELRELDLDGSHVHPDVMSELLTPGHMPRLESLNLSRHKLAWEGLSALTSISPMLRTLNLSDAELDARGVRALINTPGVESLEQLELACNMLGDEGGEEVVRAPSLARMKHLDLSGNELGDHVVTALAERGAMGHLLTLELTHNEIGDEGASALARSENLAQLELLNLHYNPLSERGEATLTAWASRQRGLEIRM